MGGARLTPELMVSPRGHDRIRSARVVLGCPGTTREVGSLSWPSTRFTRPGLARDGMVWFDCARMIHSILGLRKTARPAGHTRCERKCESQKEGREDPPNAGFKRESPKEAVREASQLTGRPRERRGVTSYSIHTKRCIFPPAQRGTRGVGPK